MRISDWSSDVCSSDLRLALLLQTQRRAVPGLAEHHVVLHEAVDLAVGVIPELLDPGLVLDRELGDALPDAPHVLFVLVGVEHAVGGNLAGGLPVEPDAGPHGVRPAHRHALPHRPTEAT